MIRIRIRRLWHPARDGGLSIYPWVVAEGDRSIRRCITHVEAMAWADRHVRGQG